MIRIMGQKALDGSLGFLALDRRSHLYKISNEKVAEGIVQRYLWLCSFKLIKAILPDRRVSPNYLKEHKIFGNDEKISHGLRRGNRGTEVEQIRQIPQQRKERRMIEIKDFPVEYVKEEKPVGKQEPEEIF